MHPKSRRVWRNEAAILVVIGMIAVVDNWTGPLLALSIFYLMPTAAGAWVLPRPVAFANVVVGGLGTFLADVLVGHRIDPGIAAINSLLRIMLFGFVIELVFRLHAELRERARLIAELQEAAAQIRKLADLVPMCAWCRKLRDDEGYWRGVEAYLEHQTGTRISHGICPDCVTKLEVADGPPLA